MEMQQVELLRPSGDLFDHAHVKSVGITYRAVEPDGGRPHWLEPRARDGIPACKQRDVMPERDEFLGQPRDDAFGSAIKLRRNSFSQR